MAKASEAKIRANKAYMKRAYDTKIIQMPKGALEQINEKAAAEGISVNRYILEAVEQRSGLHLTLDGEFKTKKKTD